MNIISIMKKLDNGEHFGNDQSMSVKLCVVSLHFVIVCIFTHLTNDDFGTSLSSTLLGPYYYALFNDTRTTFAYKCHIIDQRNQIDVTRRSP